MAACRGQPSDCRTGRLSPVWACRKVGSQVGIPNEIALLVGYDKLKQMCHVVWRSDTRLGVEIRVA